MKEIFYGRELLISELDKAMLPSLDQLNLMENEGFVEKSGNWYCRRCNYKVARNRKKICQCDFTGCNYCTNCLLMGKVSRHSIFYSLPEPNLFPKKQESCLEWEGTLSKQQSKASKDIIHSINHNETRLLWAVAGAGKTEMLFQGINEALMDQKRVCIASPRVDVCLELAPRIQAAFPSVDLTVLYGEMEEEYRYTQLVIATTHQLYRFKEAFDLLIIDEIDAFPFHLDQYLWHGAQKARKKVSSLIYLSATPDQQMQKKIGQKKLQATILPARYHGYPLPVPQGRWLRNWQVSLLDKPKHTSVIRHIENLLHKQKRFLVFIPNIQWMLKFEKKLRVLFKEAVFESVYSSDEQRKDKVLKMRNKKLDFLLTTTILERGVTFPNVDVIVIGAEDRTFTESALVQIAGRVGRSPDFPTGEVTLYHNGWSKGMKRAIKQIKNLNQLAEKRGLLHGKPMSAM